MTNSTVDFIEQVASDQSTPAGGSASAMSGALGCALMLKAVKLLLKQKEHAGDKQQLQSMQVILEEAKETFMNFATLDSELFDEFMKAQQKKDIDANLKQDTVENALIKATELPLKVMAQVVDLSVTVDKLLMYAPYSFISDVQTATLLLNVAFEGSKKNVLYNAKGIQTAQEVSSMLVQAEEMSHQWNYFIRLFDQYEKRSN